MPVPRLNMPKIPKTPEEKIKLHKIIGQLCNMGYDICSVHDAIRIIENKHIDKSLFDYPYGSFEEFKKHATAGDLEMIDPEKTIMTDKRKKEINQALKEGRLWITY